MNSYHVKRKRNIEKGIKINEGLCAEIFEWEDRHKIIKLAKNINSHHDMQLEYLNSQVAWNNGVPIPQPFELTYIDGRPGIVSERIYGTTLMQYFQRQWLNNTLDKNDVMQFSHKEIAQMTARMLYKTHNVSVVNMPSQRDTITNAIKHAKHLTASELKSVVNMLNSIPKKQQLCHGDLNLNNIIIRNNEAILIDWMQASMGNPAADLAEFILMIKYGELPLKDPIREIIIETLLDEYTKLSDITPKMIDNWMLPVAVRRRSLGILPFAEKRKLSAEIRERLKKYTSIK